MKKLCGSSFGGLTAGNSNAQFRSVAGGDGAAGDTALVPPLASGTNAGVGGNGGAGVDGLDGVAAVTPVTGVPLLTNGGNGANGGNGGPSGEPGRRCAVGRDKRA